jgi:tripeptide aminopeptidase
MKEVKDFVERNSSTVKEVFEAIEGKRQVLVDRVRRIAEIPSPTFQEERRSAHLMGLFPNIGLKDCRQLAKGSVLGFTGSVRDSDTIVLAAHIDTVFPINTELATRIEDRTLFGPGTGDNATNVAAIVTLAEILMELGITPRRNLAFCGTVCEEGPGNLAGMEEVLDFLGDRVGRVVAVDGRTPFLMHRSQAVRRYRVETSGPGGHSWDGFGTPSAIHEMARIIAVLSEVKVPAEPKTVFNVGTIRGGRSVNAIAQSCVVDVDLRSLERDDLEELERRFLRIVRETPADGIRTRVEMTGERPAAAEPAGSHLVKAAADAARYLGFEAEHVASSTDAALSLSRGLSSISLGTYRGRGTHTLEEQVDLTSLTTGLKWLALTVLVIAA